MKGKRQSYLISSGHELEEAFFALHDSWEFPRFYIEHSFSREADAYVTLDYGKKETITLPVEFKTYVPVNLDRFQNKLLVLPRIPEGHFIKKAFDKHVAVADLNGAFYYQKGKTLIAVQGNPARPYRFASGARDIFSGKSERIIRALLLDTTRLWNQHDLASAADVSVGLVNKVIKSLEEMQFIARGAGRKIMISQPLELLNLWKDKRQPKIVAVHYSLVGISVGELTTLLYKWATRNNVLLAFTQWVAAWQRSPFTEPPLCSAYLSQIPKLSDISPSLTGRKVEQGGNLILYLPEDPDVLSHHQVINNLPLVSDAQIYLDLKDQGLRSNEAIEALIQQPDFCKKHEA